MITPSSSTVSLRPDAPDLIALDGKTARRSGDEAASLKPIHLVSAWASTQRLVLAQEAVDAKDNECAAILSILDRLTSKGALVTIDAIATNPAVAKAITDKGGDYYWTSPGFVDGFQLRRSAHRISFRIRGARDSPKPSVGAKDCRSPQ